MRSFTSSPNIITVIKSSGIRREGTHSKQKRNEEAYKTLVGRSEGKRPLGGQRRRWEDNIKMDRKETRYKKVDWSNLA
jgi:hypothetical protein